MQPIAISLFFYFSLIWHLISSTALFKLFCIGFMMSFGFIFCSFLLLWLYLRSMSLSSLFCCFTSYSEAQLACRSSSNRSIIIWSKVSDPLSSSV